MDHDKKDNRVDPQRLREEMGLPEPESEHGRRWYIPDAPSAQALVIGVVGGTLAMALAFPDYARDLRTVLGL